MPRVTDKFPTQRGAGGSSLHSPTRGGLPYEDPMSAINDTAGTVGDSIHGGLSSTAEAFGSTLFDLGRFLLSIPGEIWEGLIGGEDNDPNDLGTALLKINYWAQTTINNIVQQWLGWIGDIDWDPDDSAQALADQASTIAGLSAAVTALQNSQNNQAVGGKSALIDLTLRPSGSTFGADFLHIRSGPGTGHYGIVNGVGGKWDSVSDDDAADAFTYLDLQTATDYQKVWLAVGSAPVWFNSLNKASVEIHVRKNSAGTSYGYAYMEKYRAELGCVVAGSKTVFTTKTTGFSFKANSVYALEAGTIGGLRIFRLLEGNIPILTHTEVGTTSMVGPAYRYTGGAGRAMASSLGTVPPSTIWVFAMGDNNPPAVVGSGARMFRTTTGNFSIYSGVNTLPNNTFNNLGANTSDFVCDLTTGKFTCTRADWYRVTLRIQVDTPGNFPAHVQALARVNVGAPIGARDEYIGPDAVLGNTAGNAYAPAAVYGSADVYLDVDEYVQGGYDASTTFGNFKGESTGAKTFFSIAAIGNPNLGAPA